ncbi:hypothetical protein [Nocardia terpenica]|uniref:hypothetical protein n=1 Tax=Nocardia terpenica TaxID=455432 RepID=UPI001E4108FB|nr:hypothetical protein [Nocardia terpenica]
MHDTDHAPSVRELTAWSAAAADLYSIGCTPIIPAEIARVLWRKGGAARELAERVYRAGGVAA